MVAVQTLFTALHSTRVLETTGRHFPIGNHYHGAGKNLPAFYRTETALFPVFGGENSPNSWNQIKPFVIRYNLHFLATSTSDQKKKKKKKIKPPSIVTVLNVLC